MSYSGARLHQGIVYLLLYRWPGLRWYTRPSTFRRHWVQRGSLLRYL